MKLGLTFMTKDYTRKNSMSKKFDGTEEGGGGGVSFFKIDGNVGSENFCYKGGE